MRLRCFVMNCQAIAIIFFGAHIQYWCSMIAFCGSGVFSFSKVLVISDKEGEEGADGRRRVIVGGLVTCEEKWQENHHHSSSFLLASLCEQEATSEQACGPEHTSKVTDRHFPPTG